MKSNKRKGIEEFSKTKKQHALLKGLCDDESSSDYSIHASSDEEIADKSKRKKSLQFLKDNEKTSKDNSKSDKYKHNEKNKSINHTIMNKKIRENILRKDQDSDSSDSMIHQKSKSKDVKFCREEAGSSSGKEFTQSKILHSKKLTNNKENRLISKSTMQLKDNAISKKHSLLFKSNMVKILNKFKEICSEYELRMEHVKWKHFKREILCHEAANKVIEKSGIVINDLKTQLEVQERNLTEFYEEWKMICDQQDSDPEESSQTDEEKEINPIDKAGSDSSATVFSDCDKEIFSQAETQDEDKKIEDTHEMSAEESMNDTLIEESHSKSPVLDHNREKDTQNRTSPTRDDSLNETEKTEDECANKSQDMSNESADITVKSEEEKDECNENNIEDSNTNVGKDNNEKGNLESDETLASGSEDQENVIPSSTKKKNLSDEIDEEDEAKKALLNSDSDSFMDDSSIIEASITEECSKIDDLKSKIASQTLKVDKKDTSIRKDSLPIEQDESMTEENAKRALLESNSDDSDTRSSSNKKQDSDNSDSRTNGSKKKKILEKEDKDSDGSSNDSTSKNDNELKIKKKESVVNKKRTSYSFIGNFDSSDRMFSCKVVVERLSGKALKKYKNALEKSRQYLKNKEDSREFESLIDLDRLEKNHRKESSRSSHRTGTKNKKKEEEDTLMDHLKKIEKGEFENIDEGSVVENNSLRKPESDLLSNETLIKEADEIAKKMLLCSSDSDTGEQKNSESNDEIEEEDKKIEYKSKSKDSLNKSKSNEKEKDSDKENEERKKSKWKQDKLLRAKISSDSDSSTREKWKKKQDKLKKEKDNHGEDSQNDDKIVKRKRRNIRKIINSDSDVEMNSSTQSDDSIASVKSVDSDSSVSKQKKKSKRKNRQSSSNSDNSITEIRAKPKRRRIKNVSSSDSDESENDCMSSSQGTPGKKGRKNIRKVIKDKSVAEDTKQAAKEEEERIKRIAEREKLFNELYESRLANEEKVDKLVLDFDPETKKELVVVNEALVKHLKPHQAKGIKFMWDACFESLERMQTSSGSGCIIAHCMGLGKTLQVIALAHTLLTNEKIDIKTILVVTPLNTVLNWKNEFDLWLKDFEDDDINVYELTKLKKNVERMYQLQQWQRDGGVLVMGYEMFRNLCGTNNKMRKTMREEITKCLIDPGPDVIVCDEGHLLKNEDTALSKTITKVRTSRRIVLTGTPLQNNLSEYHCMVQFVKPKLLGTRKEFLNRFVNPINNGQYDDSTESDVKLMKKRAYVLHKMLKGCVQRCDYSVLMPFLPPKQEYVIFVNLTEVQIKMYRHYLENFARRQTTGCLFTDFQSLQRIWTHPMVMRLNAEKMEKINEKRLESDSEGSLKNFINDDNSDEESSTSSASDDNVQSVDSTSSNKHSRNTRSNKNASPIVLDEDKEEPAKKEEEWWMQYVQEEHFQDMRISSKLMILFGILSECEKLGDKVLVFSQSLYSLTLIEQFLNYIDDATQTGATSELINGHTGSWSLGLDYFRLDGQTSPENRNRWCKIFNRPTNTRARLFLISTRAGGLGINLTAANRVIIFDASWNPSHDVQSIFRVYRFGQKKPCYVYRLLAAGTMEEKIYNRQVTKLSLSCRVVDEQQIERHFTNNNLSELYCFEPNTSGSKRTLSLPKDRLLAEIFLKYKDNVENYLEHDSLLENKAGEELDEEERKQAWLEYEEEKKGKPPQTPVMAIPNFQNMAVFNLPGMGQINFPMEYNNLQELIRKDYPNATPEQQKMLTTRALGEMYNYYEKETISRLQQNANTNLMNQMNATQIQQLMNTTHIQQIMNTTQIQQIMNTNQIQNANANQMRIPQMRAHVQNVNTNQMQSRVQLPNARSYGMSYTDGSSVTKNSKQDVPDDDVEVISDTVNNKNTTEE